MSLNTLTNLKNSTDATVEMIDALLNFNDTIIIPNANVRQAAKTLMGKMREIKEKYPIIV